MVKRMMAGIMAIVFCIVLAGCVSQADLDKKDAEIKKLNESIATLTAENEAVKKELEEIKAAAAKSAEAAKKSSSKIRGGKRAGTRSR